MNELVPSNTVTITMEDGRLYKITIHQSALPDSHIIALWLAGKSEKSAHAYSSDINRFYQKIEKCLAQVDLEDIYKFRNSLMHLKPSSRNRTMAAVKSLFSFAAKSRHIPYNVAAVYQLPKLENTLAERIMSEQAVLDILLRETDQRNHAILSLLYYGGLRASEISNLKWRNLQERNATGQMAVFGKGRKTRHILLDAETWQEVWSLRGDSPLDGYVFLSRQEHSRKEKQDRRISEARIHQIVRNAADRAGVAVGKVSPHWFRHAHGSHSLDAGATIAEVQSDMGHESIETTAKYLHVRPGTSTASMLRKHTKKTGEQ